MRPFIQRPFNPRAKVVIGQKAFCNEGNQNRVTNIGNVGPNSFNGQIIGKVAGTDDLDAIVENEKADQ